MPGDVSSVVVLGVGNLLRQDEGVGVHAVRAIAAAEACAGASLVDGGTAVFDALSNWTRIGKLVIIDALRAGRPAGSIARVSLRDVADRAAPALSLHEQGLLEALATLQQAGLEVGEIVIYGVEPAQTDWGTGLSEPVEACLPLLAAHVQAECLPPSLEEKLLL
jgi:hydrogenase maturation protease